MEKPVHSEALLEYIYQHKYFWWWVPEAALSGLSLSSIVEGTLSYGSIADIKQLFVLMTIEQVSEIFYEATQKSRINYHKRTLHFFDLYFKRHVPAYSLKRAAKSYNSPQPV